MKLNILVKNPEYINHYGVQKAILRSIEKYKKRGYDLVFDWEDKNRGYHITLEIYTKTGSNSGWAGELGDDKKNKENGWYPIGIGIGDNDGDGSLGVMLEHEIMHPFYFEYEIGYLHSLDIPTVFFDDKQKNKANWKYFEGNAIRENVPREIIVHHTANENWTYKETRNYHKSEGWSDIGYHDFYEKNGRKKIGRWHERRGAHTKEQNKNFESIGKCIAGNYSIEKEVPLKQKNSLGEDLVELGFEDISPHRKYKNTQCYGKNLSDDWAKNLFNINKNDMLYIKSDNFLDKRRWKVENGRRFWIADPTSRDRLGIGESDFVVDDLSKYPYAGQCIIANPDEPII